MEFLEARLYAAVTLSYSYANEYHKRMSAHRHTFIGG